MFEFHVVFVYSLILIDGLTGEVLLGSQILACAVMLHYVVTADRHNWLYRLAFVISVLTVRRSYLKRGRFFPVSMYIFVSLSML